MFLRPVVIVSLQEIIQALLGRLALEYYEVHVPELDPAACTGSFLYRHHVLDVEVMSAVLFDQSLAPLRPPVGIGKKAKPIKDLMPQQRTVPTLTRSKDIMQSGTETH